MFSFNDICYLPKKIAESSSPFQVHAGGRLRGNSKQLHRAVCNIIRTVWCRWHTTRIQCHMTRKPQIVQPKPARLWPNVGCWSGWRHFIIVVCIPWPAHFSCRRKFFAFLLCSIVSLFYLNCVICAHKKSSILWFSVLPSQPPRVLINYLRDKLLEVVNTILKLILNSKRHGK